MRYEAEKRDSEGCVKWVVIGEDHEADKKRGFRVTEKGVVLVTPDMLNQTTHARR